MTKNLPYITQLAQSHDPEDRSYYEAFLYAERELKAYLKSQLEGEFGLPPMEVPEPQPHAVEWILRVGEFDRGLFEGMREFDAKMAVDRLEAFYWQLFARKRRSSAYVDWMRLVMGILLETRPMAAAKGWAAMAGMTSDLTDKEKANCLKVTEGSPALQMAIYHIWDKDTQARVFDNALAQNDPRALYLKAKDFKAGSDEWCELIEKAAKLGDPFASGRWLDHVMEKDPQSDEAKAWLLACENHVHGYPVWKASYYYWFESQPAYNLPHAVSLVERSARLGYEGAFYQSALTHLEGYVDDDGLVADGMPETTPRRVAMGFVELVAAALPFESERPESVEALGKLAYLYMTGQFIEEDPLMVAYLGLVAARFELPVDDPKEEGGEYAWWVSGFFREGFMVKKDLALEEAWQKVAAQRGHPSAMYNMGCNYWNNSTGHDDDCKAIAWWRHAWEDHHVELALVRLAQAAKLGRGLKRDLGLSERLFEKARELGVDEDTIKILTRDRRRKRATAPSTNE